MKNLLLTFKLILIFFSSTVTALTSYSATNPRERIPISVFTVELRPPITVLQISSERRIRFGNIVGEELGLIRYRGYRLRQPIQIRYDMTSQQIADALCASFGVSQVRYLEGVIIRKHFERIFPPFSFFDT